MTGSLFLEYTAHGPYTEQEREKEKQRRREREREGIGLSVHNRRKAAHKRQEGHEEWYNLNFT